MPGLVSLYKTNYDGKTGEEDEEWEGLQTMMCPPRVLGYIIREKKWAQLDINGLRETPKKTDEEAILRKLHLADEDEEDNTKSLLMGLVKTHSDVEVGKENKRPQMKDIVPEKGKGLVILLYGTLECPR